MFESHVPCCMQMLHIEQTIGNVCYFFWQILIMTNMFLCCATKWVGLWTIGFPIPMHFPIKVKRTLMNVVSNFIESNFDVWISSLHVAVIWYSLTYRTYFGEDYWIFFRRCYLLKRFLCYMIMLHGLLFFVNDHICMVWMCRSKEWWRKEKK